MRQWGFVFLAYGIVWSTIVVYVTMLKRRLAKAERDLVAVQAGREFERHEKE
jgi:CcmD family protein